jgi:zinc transport system permease protein
VERVRLLFMLLVAIVVAIAMKVIGILLITALLIIPAATARRFSSSPESMAVTSIILGAVAVVLGLIASMQWDSPVGPSIVVVTALSFFMSRLKRV